MRHSHIRIRCRLPSRTRTPPASRNASSYPCNGPVVLVTGLILVGRRGVEPRDTCLSGRPRRPAGSRPVDGRGPEPQATVRLPRPASNGRLPPGRFTIHKQESGRLERQRLTTPGRFRGGACTLAGSLSEEDGELESQRRRRPRGFQPRPEPCPVHPPARRAEQSKPTPHARGCALVSSEARGPCPVHSPSGCPRSPPASWAATGAARGWPAGTAPGRATGFTAPSCHVRGNT
jgi:hypothetical protein